MWRVYFTNFNFKGKFISLGCHFLISLVKNHLQRFSKLFGSWAKLNWQHFENTHPAVILMITTFQQLTFQSWFTRFWQQTHINKFLQPATPFKWLLHSINVSKELDKMDRLKRLKSCSKWPHNKTNQSVFAITTCNTWLVNNFTLSLMSR